MANEKETSEVKETTSDLLEEVKRIERAVRAKALAKMLVTLKQKAHEVLELKEYTKAVLEELGVEEGDQKRLIDWINSLDQVKLTKGDKEDIRDEAHDDVTKERQDAEKKMPDSVQQFMGFSQSIPAYQTAIGTASGTTTTYPAITTTTAGLGLPAINYVNTVATDLGNLNMSSFNVLENKVSLTSGDSSFKLALK